MSRHALFRLALAFWGYSAPESNAQWIQVRDLPGGRIQDYCVIDSGFFLAMEGRIFRSGDGGACWTPLPSPGTNLEVYSLEEFEGTLLAGTPSGVYRSPIKNVGWESFDRPGLPRVPALSLWTYLGYLYIGSEGAVYKSIDQGRTWAELKSGLPRDARITRFAGIVKIVVAGSDNRGVFITESTKWIPPPDFDSADYPIQDLDVFGNKVYAVTAHGVLESGNLGADWGSAPLTLHGITSLIGYDGRLFAGTARGISYSTDKGKTWVSLKEGLPGYPSIRSLVELGGTIFASTDKGVWRTTSPTAGIPSRPSESFLPAPRPHGIRRLIGILPPDADPARAEWIDFSGRRVWPDPPSHAGP